MSPRKRDTGRRYVTGPVPIGALLIGTMLVGTLQAAPNAAPGVKVGHRTPVFAGDIEAYSDFTLPSESAAQDPDVVESVDATHDAAIEAAKSQLESVLTDGGVDSPEYVQALSQLAGAQQLAADYESSIQNFEAAVASVEARGDRLSTDLVGPLWGLSRAYLDGGYGIEAIESYERALHIKKVNDGLHSPDQAELLAEMSEAFLAMGDTDRALGMMEATVSLAERNYPGDDLRKLPALYDRARMLERVGETIEAHGKYRRIISLIERSEGGRSLELLPALERISNVFLYNKMLDGMDGAQQAKRYVRRAVYIVDKNPAATPLQKADAYVGMGDYLSLKSNNGKLATRYYRDAWNFLTDAGLLDERDERFGRPMPINDVPDNSTLAFRDLVGSMSDPVGHPGSVVIGYDVDEDGDVTRDYVLHSDPPGYRDEIVRYHLSRILFRPKFADGEPVVSSGNQYRVPFTYRESELPNAVADRIAASDSN